MAIDRPNDFSQDPAGEQQRVYKEYKELGLRGYISCGQHHQKQKLACPLGALQYQLHTHRCLIYA